MHFDKYVGLAYVCSRFHSGQWSRGYRLLCKIEWNPGTIRSYSLLPREDWRKARMWAAHYMKLARKNPRMF